MTEDELFRIYQLDGIVTTADAELIENQLANYFETTKQIATADRIVLTKTDRVSREQATAATEHLKSLNPSAEIITAVMGDCAPELLTNLNAYEPVAAKAHAEAWLADDAYEQAHACAGADCDHPDHGHDHDQHRGHHDGHHHEHGHDHSHTHGVQSFALTFRKPLDGQKLSFAMELLRMTHGDKLLRIKGIAAIAGEPLPFVVHGVQHVFYPPTTMDAWPSADHETSRFVFITKDLSEAAVQQVLASAVR